MTDRRAGLFIALGVGCIVLGAFLASVPHDPVAAAVSIVIGGALLLLVAAPERLRSIGPKGAEFYELKREAIDVVEMSAPPSRDVVEATGVVTGPVDPEQAQLVAAVDRARERLKAAKDTGEMLQALLEFYETAPLPPRRERRSEQLRRITSDDAARASQRRAGPSSGSQGGGTSTYG